MRKNKHGFTLIELIIVIIIVGILAAVAAPIMTGIVKKAKTAEAVAALGTLRTCARVYYVEHDKTYPNDITQIVGDGKYMKDADLNGKYYSRTGYTIESECDIIQAEPDTPGEGDKIAIIMSTGELTEWVEPIF